MNENASYDYIVSKYRDFSESIENVNHLIMENEQGIYQE